jgi:hypothetical protein
MQDNVLVVGTEEVRNSYRIFVGETQGKNILGYYAWVGNGAAVVNGEIGYQGVEWIKLVHNILW